MKKAKLLLCSIAIFTLSLQSCVNKGETSSSSISQSTSTSTSTSTSSESSLNKKITKFELVGDKTSLKEGEVVTLSVNVEGENLTQEDKKFTISIEKGEEFVEKLTDLTYKGKKVSNKETVIFKLTSTFDSTKVANFSLTIVPTKEVSTVILSTDKEVYRVNDTIVLASTINLSPFIVHTPFVSWGVYHTSCNLYDNNDCCRPFHILYSYYVDWNKETMAASFI